MDKTLKWLVDLFTNIVALCNENSGFISAILAVVTILISIKIGRLPYQKKMFFYHYLEGDEVGGINVVLMVTNVGSCPVYIDRLYIKEGYFKTIGDFTQISNTAIIDEKLIKPQETIEFQKDLRRYKWRSSRKRKPLRIILKSGRKTFRYKTNWGMG